jgi:hypothetical protein
MISFVIDHIPLCPPINDQNSHHGKFLVPFYKMPALLRYNSQTTLFKLKTNDF